MINENQDRSLSNSKILRIQNEIFYNSFLLYLSVLQITVG